MDGNNYDQLQFLNENDPVKLLSSNNYLDQLVPIIKSSLQNNTIDSLVQKLRDEGSKKDDEIFSVLNQNEETIASSSQDIISVSKESSTISDQIVDISDHISRTSNLTIEKKFQLLELKKNISKINESEILINKILQVLELTDKTHDLIKKNKFFNALKNLNDLNGLNKDFEKEFKFLHQINDLIPVLKQLIQDESSGLLKRNLTALDPKFEQYSEAYYDSYSSMIERWEAFKLKNKEFEKYKINSSVEISLRPSYTTDSLPQLNSLVDYEFIYDSYLVFKTLDQVPFFKNELHKELNMRRDRTLYPFVPSDSQNTSFKEFIKKEENLKSFLGKLIGYLIFHHQVSIKFPTLIKQSTNDQWENISAKVYPFLKNLILNEVFEIPKIINIKKIIGQYYLILEHFQLNTEHFYNLLILSFKKFSSLASFKFAKDFEDLANEDELTPMVIYEIGLYKKITNISWFQDTKAPEEIEFPHILPFSSIYPMTCAQIRNFIIQELAFLKDYYKYEVSSLYRLLIDNVNGLFKNTIIKHFLERVNSVTREELAQNLINLEYFIIMTKEVSKLLSDKFETDMLLKSAESVLSTKTITEKKLFEVVDGKIDDLIEFIDWDWESKVNNKEPTFFIKDIGEFLTNMFNSTFKNLPLSVRALLLYRVFDLLTTRFLENLQSQYSITPSSINNFDLDISYIENITNELSPPDSSAKPSATSNISLKSMFLELRQVIDLLKSGNLDEYKDPDIRNRKYDRVKPELAVQLINKIGNKEKSTVGSPTPQTNTSSASKIFSKFRGTGS